MTWIVAYLCVASLTLVVVATCKSYEDGFNDDEATADAVFKGILWPVFWLIVIGVIIGEALRRRS